MGAEVKHTQSGSEVIPVTEHCGGIVSRSAE